LELILQLKPKVGDMGWQTRCDKDTNRWRRIAVEKEPHGSSSLCIGWCEDPGTKARAIL